MALQAKISKEKEEAVQGRIWKLEATLSQLKQLVLDLPNMQYTDNAAVVVQCTDHTDDISNHIQYAFPEIHTRKLSVHGNEAGLDVL